jgi:hypothetical protein
VYGCDAAWWRHRKGLPEYRGLKITWAGNGVTEYPDLLRVPIKGNWKERYIYSLCFEQGFIGGGGNSGFQALNLAIHFGAKEIALAGFDMNDDGGIHWYGRNRWSGSNNPDRVAFGRWLAAFDRAAAELEKRHISVVNLSRRSSLRCFPVRGAAAAFG